MARRAVLPWVLGLALAVGGCGGLAPGGNIAPLIDVDGVGTAEVAAFEVAGRPAPNGGGDIDPASLDFIGRWTGARVVLATEDGQLLVVWNGGPAACWALASIHFTGRGPRIDASVGERSVPQPGGCAGDRRLRAVFVPMTAAPVAGKTTTYPVEP
ncbi:MAG TPA: hypothetical protein VFV72_09790 [Candidatus Limnocylindrales bacterium]|nr:hypothetical protein [Candidatus Limnocylindrales bacterium]